MGPQQVRTLTPKTCAIKFIKRVEESSIGGLTTVIEHKLRQGVKRFVLLLTTSGGTVHHGLAAYNFLKGIPAEVITHNFGSIDSIGAVLYCAGTQRYSAPHARFLLHGVPANGAQPVDIEEKHLVERLKSLQNDTRSIARVIAASSGKSEGVVTRAMLNRTTLDPEKAKAWGLVHEIKSDLFVNGDELISIE